MIKNTHDLIIEGKYVNLREVEIDDAAFILSLRLSEKGSKFLHKTENDVDKQKAYLERYKPLEYEWYFIVESKDHSSLGCLGIYDVRDSSVCTGRWIMKEGSDARQGIEGDILLKDFAFTTLGATEVRMDTRHYNKNMLNYFKIWGCKEYDRDDELVYVVLDKDTYIKNKYRVARFCI